MKLSDLRPCDSCNGPVGTNFYVVRTSQALVNAPAANGILGLSQMLGGSIGLAEVMGAEPDCVMVFGDEEPQLQKEIFLCHDCYFLKDLSLAGLVESGGGER